MPSRATPPAVGLAIFSQSVPHSAGTAAPDRTLKSLPLLIPRGNTPQCQKNKFFSEMRSMTAIPIIQVVDILNASKVLAPFETNPICSVRRVLPKRTVGALRPPRLCALRISDPRVAQIESPQGLCVSG